MDLREYLLARDELEATLKHFAKLTPAQRRQVEIAATELQEAHTSFPWVPNPGPQTRAVLTPATELLYGGQAGGGKGALQVGLAISEHRRSLILRRHSTELKDLKEQLLRFAGHLGTWKSIGPHGGEFTFNDGRTVELGGCEHQDAYVKYSGRPHDLICADEAGDLPSGAVSKLAAWNRSEVKGQRCRIVLGSNPPRSAEGRWMLEAYAPWVDYKHHDPARPGELRWFTTIDDVTVWLDGPEPFVRNGKTIYPKSRTFLPARLSDNPYLSGNTDYIASLQALPDTLRRQLEDGDFSAGQEDDAWQCIPTEWVLLAQDRWRQHALAHGESPPPGQALSCLGVDVAFGGADKTCIAARYGPWFAPVKKARGTVTDSGGKAAELAIRLHDGSCPVNVDVIGVGTSCYDHLKDKVGMLAKAVNVSEAPNPPQFDRSRRFALPTYRSVMYWKLREALDPKTGDNLMLPPDPEILADLTSFRYDPRASGYHIEPKEHVKDRIGRSPDVGDAIALAHLQGPRKRNFSFGL